MPELTLNELSKRFGDVEAVRRLSITVSDGELVTFLGPSGCGKTTTLRLIAGFLVPDHGIISIGSQVVSSGEDGVALAPNRRDIGMVFQSYALWPHMTVFNNVAYGLKARNVDNAQIADRVRKALSLVRMEKYVERYPSELSGGQQQRIALARAIAYDPKILLLDEPLSNLDAKLRERMRIETRELQQRLGMTAVYVTHDQDEAMSISDRIAIMNHGVLHQLASPEEIYYSPATSFVASFIGTSNLLSGQIDRPAQKDEVVTLQLLQNGSLRARAATDIQPGDPISLCVRAENITLTQGEDKDDDGLQWLEGVVRTVSFFGDSRQYLVDVLGETFKVRTQPHVRYAPGTPVRLGVNVEDCIATRDTGERVEQVMLDADEVPA